MLLEKRESSVRAKIEPLGAESLYVSIDFGSKQLNFQPSSVMTGDQFGEFICALYTLYQEENNEIYDGHSEWREREYHTDKDQRIQSTTVTIVWDGEGPYMILEMSRAWDGDTIHIRASTDYGKTYTGYEANDRDFCYAIAKAVTEALKEFGFYGFFLSTEGSPIMLHQLLFIKAYALNNMEARKLRLRDSGYGCQSSDFDREIELLLFDM